MMIALTKLRLLAGTLTAGFVVVVGSAACEVSSQHVREEAAPQAAEAQPQEEVDQADAAVAANAEVPKAEEPAEPQEPVAKAKPVKQEPKPQQEPKPRDIAERAFPPTMPDIAEHEDAWNRNDCLRCHETGVQKAPRIRHEEMPEILLTAKCRSCHVFIPGSKPREQKKVDEGFDENAFPPMIPASPSHLTAWWKDDCKLCHEDGNKGAPKVQHKGMPRRLLTAKCRTCHVQVRTVQAEKRTGRQH